MLSTRYFLAFVILLMTVLMVGCSGKITVPEGDGVLDGVDYVSVRNEPQHRHKFENDSVRIYDVLLPPGHVTLYHAHRLDTLYVAVHGSKLKSKALTGFSLPFALPVPDGMVFWRGHEDEHLVHEVTNAGKATARLVGVELKNAATQWPAPLLSGAGLTHKSTYPKVRVYKWLLAPGEVAGLSAPGFKGILVSLSEAVIEVGSDTAAPQRLSLAPAGFQWIEDNATLKLRNIGDEPFEALLYELP